jgi:hypothetical protein
MATAADLKVSLELQNSELESVIEVYGPENVQRLESKQAWGKVRVRSKFRCKLLH